MPYDDSEQQKTYDYLRGQATGYGDNAWSRLGAEHAKQGEVAATYASPVGRGQISSETLTKEASREQRDESFGKLLAFLMVAVMAYWDYNYGPTTDWWWHLAIIFGPPAVAIWVFEKLGLIRLLRRLTLIGLVVGVGYFAYMALTAQ